jgi:hypothetical protein
MPITFKHDAAGVPFSQDENRRKYGQSLQMQQRKYDMDNSQLAQSAAYDMQRLGAGYGGRRGTTSGVMQPATMAKDPNDLISEMISSGEFYGNRDMQGVLAARAAVLADEKLDPVQRREGLNAANTRILTRLGGMQPMPVVLPAGQTVAAQTSAAKGGAPTGMVDARQHFREHPEDFDAWEKRTREEYEAAGMDLPPDNVEQAVADTFNRRQKWLWEDQNQQAAAAATPPVAPPQPTQLPRRAPGPLSAGSQSSSGRGYIFIKPKGSSVTETARPQQQQPVPQSPQPMSQTGQPMTLDTQYEIQNPQQSEGINYFDPNNPAYAAMRGPDPAYMNPSPGHTMQKLPGGGVDYGQGPSGQNVSTRVRPGGTMAEYAPPVNVKPPVTDANFPPRSPGDTPDSAQMARDKAYGKASRNAWMDVSGASYAPEEIGQFWDGKLGEAKSESDKAEYAAVRDFVAQGQPPEITRAIMVAYDSSVPKEKKRKAIEFLKANGVSLVEIAKKSRSRPVAEGVGVIPLGNDTARQFVREPKY